MSYGSRGPPEIEGMTSLKVDNLTYRTTPDDLRKVFDRYGDIGDIYIPRDRFSRESRGFAFIRFYDKRDAEDAMDSLDGYVLDGRELRVQMARYGRPSDPHRRGGGGRYGGGGGGGRSRRRSRSRSRSRSPRNRRHRSGSRTRRSRSKEHRSNSHHRSRSASPKENKRRGSKSSSRSRERSPDRNNGVDNTNHRNGSRSVTPD